MSSQRTFGGQLAQLGAIALVAGAASCGGTPAPEPAPSPVVAAPVSVRPLKVEQPAPFTPTVVQLTPDSAAARDTRRPRVPLLGTPRTPLPPPLTPPALPRARALPVDDEPVLAVPLPEDHLRLLVGRDGGPPFTRRDPDRVAAARAVAASGARARGPA